MEMASERFHPRSINPPRVPLMPLTAAPRLFTVLCVMACGCGDDSDVGAPVAGPPVPTAAEREDAGTIDELRRELGIGGDGVLLKTGGEIRVVRLPGTNVMDLSPLTGLPLRELDISNTRVSNLTPLAGMPLEELYAERSPITDLSPLAGMPLRSLYLTDTPVADVSALAGMSFQELNLVGTQVADLESCRGISSIVILWLRDTPATDLSPLKDVPVTSLDVQDTAVSDLSPLSEKHDLRRLNIAGTEVTDLWPLADLELLRLVFTPAKIESGIEAVRNMSSLTELGVQFETPDDAIPAAEFWRRYDAGEFDAPAGEGAPQDGSGR